MGLTNFPNGISSFGVPVIPVGIPIGKNSKVFFVAPHSGADGNKGTSPDRPLKTLVEALARCTAGANDAVGLIAESNTAADTTDYQSATLDWNKDLTHLFGLSAPSKYSNRARIGQLSTVTGLASLLTVSANGCAFANFSVYHGVADATSKVAVKVTGSKNAFSRVHFGGIGDATMSVAGAASLWLSGAQENVFRDCVIGLDTISRDQNPNEILVDTASTRNYFEDCDIVSYISNAGFASVKIGANGIDRTLKYKNCLFMTKSTNKGITQTSVFSIPAITQGAIILQGSRAFSDGGATDWDSNNRGIIWNDAVAAAAAAAGGILTNQ